jgi:hypothetical protein
MNIAPNPTDLLSLIALLLALLPATIRRWPHMFGVLAAFVLVQSVVAYRLSTELGAPAGPLLVPAALIVPPLALSIVIAARVIAEAGLMLWRARLRTARLRRTSVFGFGFAKRIAVCPALLPFADDVRN